MRIFQALWSGNWGDTTPDLLDKGCGGREVAAIRLGIEWARQGHEVFQFGPMEGKPQLLSGSDGGFHSYASNNLAMGALKSVPFDAVVSIERIEPFLDEQVADMQKNAARLIHMQVAHVDPRTKGEVACSYSWGVLSDWHRRFLKLQVPDGDFHVLPNGYEPSLYPRELAQKDREAPHFLYSSSPDRGLIHLLEAWPKIRRELPDATLSVGYGAEDWCKGNLPSHFAQGDVAARVLESLEQEGIVSEGLMGQKQLANLQLKVQLQLYPANTMQATETGCISLIEASAAGLPGITTNCDCLGDEFTGVHEVLPLPIEISEYVDRVVEFSKDLKRRKNIRERGFEFIKGRSWKDLSKRWIDLFHTLRG